MFYAALPRVLRGCRLVFSLPSLYRVCILVKCKTVTTPCICKYCEVIRENRNLIPHNRACLPWDKGCSILGKCLGIIAPISESISNALIRVK